MLSRALLRNMLEHKVSWKTLKILALRLFNDSLGLTLIFLESSLFSGAFTFRKMLEHKISLK